MNMQQLFPVLKQVFTNPYIIITAVVVFLYMDFCIYVANYVKKPKKSKKKWSSPAPVAAAAPKSAENTEDEEGDGETT